MKAKPILHLNTGYAENGYDPVIAAQSQSQIQVYSARLLNESGGASDLALLQSLNPDLVSYYEFDGTSATDVTADVAAGTSVDLFTATALSGFIVETNKKINAFMVNVDGAQSGAQTFKVYYSNGGSIAEALQVVSIPVSFTSGRHIVLFSCGPDYAPDSGLTGVDSSKYQILLECQEGGETCTIDAAKAAISVQYSPAVANNGSLEAAFSEQYPLMLEANESIVPYFEQESDNNKVIAFYQFQN